MVGIYHIWRKPTVKSKVSRVVFAVSNKCNQKGIDYVMG